MLLTDGLTVGRTYVFTVTAVDGLRRVTSEEIDLTAVLLSGTGGGGQHSWRDFNPLDGPRIVPSPVTNLQNSSNKYTVVHMY